MGLHDFLAERSLTAAGLASRVGCDKSYLSHVLAGRKSLYRPVAIRIFREFGVKLGPIAEASDDEIAALERFAA